MNDRSNFYSYPYDYLGGPYPGGWPDDQSNINPGMTDLVWRGGPTPLTTVPYDPSSPMPPTLVSSAPPIAPALPGMPAAPYLPPITGRDSSEDDRIYNLNGGLVRNLPIVGFDAEPHPDFEPRTDIAPQPAPAASFNERWSPLAGQPSGASALPVGLGWAPGAQFNGGAPLQQAAMPAMQRWEEAQYAQEGFDAVARQQRNSVGPGRQRSPSYTESANIWGALPAQQLGTDAISTTENPLPARFPDAWTPSAYGYQVPHQESADAFGAIPPQLQGQATEFANTRYLAPVPQAPDWAQVPNSNTRTARSGMPGATSWGKADRGVICDTADGITTCTTPGGRQFPFPAWQGFPEHIEPGMEEYHYYSRPVSGPPADAARVTQALIDTPTVGPREHVSPATTAGTLNEATPDFAYYPLRFYGRPDIERFQGIPNNDPINGVMSYLTTDQNGQKIVVNVTQPEHRLVPGMVIRYVTESPSGTTIQTEGTGLGPLQGPTRWGSLRDQIAGVWQQQGKRILKEFSK